MKKEMRNSSPYFKSSGLSASALSASSASSSSSFGVPSDAASSISLTSTAWRAQPTLIKDSNHKPKTHGSFGILVVGLGGANGTTLLAGILANRMNIQWRGPKGEPMTPNYNGCITQLDQRGAHGGVGYRNVVKGLANASMAAVGGWDIRDTKPGDALLEAQILDYDLVRQVQSEMNNVKVFRGLFDPRFIGSSQHETATYILTDQEAKSDSEALKCLRADIRYFKWRNGVVGHTTVIWSASVEPNSSLVSQIRTATELLDSIAMTENKRGGPLPPSLLYATAALLEGCSFVNGGSQNTLDCPGLAQLAQQQLGVYCLGTDFKAGQTKFKTAAVEYLRTMGLTPKVIASSNHLGNNDMKNLASAKAASDAKLKVKHDIFAPWHETELDHKVSIMYTPYINDDKRDFVEYTSLAFLGQPHTMVTYTRASDSVLCVPLIIDAAVWCDYFSQRSWSFEKVAKALAYLFKVPEGAAKGVDPGFFRQMEELRVQVMAAHESRSTHGKSRRVRIREENGQAVVSEWAIPGDAGVICAGLACLDRQLNSATGVHGCEGFETFQGETSIGGGSVSIACKTIARLHQGAPIGDGYLQETPPVVSSIAPLCMIGNDDCGNKLLSLLENYGSGSQNVDTRVVRNKREKRPDIRTGLSILPIYSDGRRGCFFDAASNATFSPEHVIDMLGELSSSAAGRVANKQMNYGALLFGYPHLLPMMQGKSLSYIFSESRKILVNGGIVALDLNGVPERPFVKTGELRSLKDLKNDRVIGPALEHTDILHMNEDELVLLTGCRLYESSVDDEVIISKAAGLFLRCGVAVVAITRGKKGSYVACNNEERFKQSPMLPKRWMNCSAHIPAMKLSQDTRLNTNGAGDSFTAGLVVASMLRHTGIVASAEKRSTDSGEKFTALSTVEKESSFSQTPSKRLTPYSLYLRENYSSLKLQCKGDKRAIFMRCHDMWENESTEVKALYERMASEENEEAGSNTSTISANEISLSLDNSLLSNNTSYSGVDNSGFQSGDNVNKSLNLEAAVQFAGAVAAHHIDMKTRDLDYVDINSLLEKATFFHEGTHEI